MRHHVFWQCFPIGFIAALVSGGEISTYIDHSGADCSGSGATHIDRNNFYETLENCQALCDKSNECEGFTYHTEAPKGKGGCWRLKWISIGSCHMEPFWDTYTKNKVSPPLQPTFASATTLKVTWSDCGQGAHAKISGFSPATLETGQKTTMTGTGILDEDVSSATYDLEMKTAVKTISCKGDASQSKTCDLPLGTGSLTFEPMSFPLKKGSIPVSVSIMLSKLLPTSLAKTETTVKATGPNREQLFCIDIKTAPAAEASTSATEVVI